MDSRQDEQSFDILQAFYSKQIVQRQKLATHQVEDIRDLIRDMLANFDTVMIIVDGLDRCGTETETGTLVEILACLSCNDSVVKTLFFSRYEQLIRDCSGDYRSDAVGARNSDIRLYVGSEIETRGRKNKVRVKDSSLKNYIKEYLAEKGGRSVSSPISRSTAA